MDAQAENDTECSFFAVAKSEMALMLPQRSDFASYAAFMPSLHGLNLVSR